ncbi:MFS transporter [Polaromonas hydrogenivorans]|uniref:MFS transporter n=1 Tax=Polaromonas hydrogenivorans TaxID=335476 RepID=A0AAU7LYG8_9BURK
MTSPSDDLSPLAPLRAPVFRMLWTAWLTANICMAMNDVAAAWKMTTLTTTPIWVALVQSAATIPMLLLGLPSGALADILDRKVLLLFTQVWVATMSALLCAAMFLDLMTPPLLLALTLANGIAMAVRWPAFAAIVPALVPRKQLPAALALNGLATNISRIVGPLVAGALIAAVGTVWVFLLNAVMSVFAAITISRWRQEKKVKQGPPEQLGTAIKAGWQFMRQSLQLQGVLLRVTLFFFHSSALLSLLTLLARRLEGGGAGTFTLLLASMGLGAVTGVGAVPALRQWMARNRLVLLGSLVVATCMVLMAAIPLLAVAIPVMIVCGLAWLVTASTLSLSAQLCLPNWVRARGMSMQQMSLFGGNALGAAFWGAIATWTSVPIGLMLAAASLVICMFAATRWAPDIDKILDMTQHEDILKPQPETLPASRQVLVAIEYRIDPTRSADFRKLMQKESRASRLRLGAVSWDLVRDINLPGRFVEHIVDTSWEDYLRRYERLSVADAQLHEHRKAFVLPGEPLRVTRYHVETHD